MKFRELLQTEIWSKRTTRRMIVWSGTVLGFVAAVLVIFIAVERYWLTPGERRAGKAALAQIDQMQDLDSTSSQEFAARSYWAQAKIDVAQNAAWTWRDQGTAECLSIYLEMTKLDREAMQRRKMIEQKYPALAQKDVEMAEQSTATDKKLRIMYRGIMHRMLD